MIKIFNYKVIMNNKYLYHKYNKNKIIKYFKFLFFMKISRIMQIMFYSMLNSF